MPDFVGGIMEKVQQITEMGKSNKDLQGLINVSEVFYVWDIMVMKFDILTTVMLMENFIKDKDLKFIAAQLSKGLITGIEDMEQVMKDHSIPFPPRPPVSSNTTAVLEDITDQFIYGGFYESIQSFFPVLSGGFMNSTSPKVRNAIKSHLLLTIELQELIVEYGKLKGFLNPPPVYRA
ncbi:hypothetical protein [Dethiobacter alkaliphilus]|uniref:hypothetical protein n=1 Tax=Dethiobacter alkaliphilus TaxID=427926 RepID=UPI002226AD9A|nr:hypothetical protein [Dethiobacter alkaliphilus]MCW3491640.1 hypothetical protein [Dethiobacter alkaliphilus]